MIEKELLEQGYRKYRGKEIDVYFYKDKCIKSRNCVLGAPEVSNTSEKPWIQTDNVSKEKVMAVVDKCPLQALMYVSGEEDSK